MIDLILLAFTVSMFVGGFWCGSKYQTVGAMWAEIKKMMQ